MAEASYCSAYRGIGCRPADGASPPLFANFILDPSPLVRAQWGFSLLGVYIAWLAIVVAMYPLARWFAEVKRRRRDWWLSYA